MEKQDWLKNLDHKIIRNKILSNATLDLDSKCWMWTNTIDRQGYARLHVNKGKKRLNPTLAHRLSYIIFVGEIECGLCICHKCDTPSCVNPGHLFMATQQENLEDMRRKGRERGMGYLNSKKKKCNKGHPLSGSNLRIEGIIQARRCRECERIKKNG